MPRLIVVAACAFVIVLGTSVLLISMVGGDEVNVDLLREQRVLNDARDQRYLAQQEWVRKHERLWSATPPMAPHARQKLLVAVNHWRRAIGGGQVVWQYEREDYFTVAERADPQLAAGSQLKPQTLHPLFTEATVVLGSYPALQQQLPGNWFISERLYHSGHEVLAWRGALGLHIALQGQAERLLQSVILWQLLQQDDAPVQRHWSAEERQHLLRVPDAVGDLDSFVTGPITEATALRLCVAINCDNGISTKLADLMKSGQLSESCLKLLHWLVRHSQHTRLQDLRLALK